MRSGLFAIFLLGGNLMASDCTHCDGVRWQKGISPERQLIGEMEVDTIINLEKKHGIHFGGFSGGPMPRDEFKVTFSVDRDFKIKQEIIELVLDCALTYLENINSNEKMKPTVFRYPFPMKNIEISLQIANRKQQLVCHPLARWVEWKDGELVFTTYKREKPTERYTITKVSLEEVMPTLSADLQKRLKEATIN